MTYFDEQLRQLHGQIARSAQLTAMVKELRQQKETLSAQAEELGAVMRFEQSHVDRLEGRSLAAFFYNVVGKMDEKLDRERREAYAARVKYDAAAKELEAVERDLAGCEEELFSLRGCETRYEEVLKQKLFAVKAAGGAAAEEIMELEARIAYLESQKKELREAMFAGKNALAIADQVLDSLDSAEGWGTWDLLGGGLIADIAKHNHLDSAQSSIEDLQSQLRRFKTELADVTVHADMQVNVDGFLRFADYFFDGLFADWTVLDRIGQSQSQVSQTRSQIETVLSRLDAMTEAVSREQAEVKSRLDALARGASL